MPFVRRLYQSHSKEWFGIEESQQFINKKVAIANERTHGTTRKKPIELLVNEETGVLKPLPALAYDLNLAPKWTYSVGALTKRKPFINLK